MKNEIFFTDTGSGLPVILIPGYCETHRIWDEFSRKLSRWFRVITIDLPGFGESAQPPVPFTLNDIAGMIHDLVMELKPGPQVLIGHSLGGYVTLAYARQYENELRGFGLFHSTAYADSQEKKESRTRLIGIIEETGAAAFIRNFFPSLFYDNRRTELASPINRLIEGASEISALSIREYARAMRDREDNRELLKSFRKPVMMIVGENDASVPLNLSQEQSRLIQRPYILTLKETGHMGMFERPVETLHFVQNFLNVCQ
jgi:pimeloyl-ACP methyl ester carboxylesterase